MPWGSAMPGRLRRCFFAARSTTSTLSLPSAATKRRSRARSTARWSMRPSTPGSSIAADWTRGGGESLGAVSCGAARIGSAHASWSAAASSAGCGGFDVSTPRQSTWRARVSVRDGMHAPQPLDELRRLDESLAAAEAAAVAVQREERRHPVDAEEPGELGLRADVDALLEPALARGTHGGMGMRHGIHPGADASIRREEVEQDRGPRRAGTGEELLEPARQERGVHALELDALSRAPRDDLGRVLQRARRPQDRGRVGARAVVAHVEAVVAQVHLDRQDSRKPFQGLLDLVRSAQSCDPGRLDEARDSQRELGKSGTIGGDRAAGEQARDHGEADEGPHGLAWEWSSARTSSTEPRPHFPRTFPPESSR